MTNPLNPTGKCIGSDMARGCPDNADVMESTEVGNGLIAARYHCERCLGLYSRKYGGMAEFMAEQRVARWTATVDLRLDSNGDVAPSQPMTIADVAGKLSNEDASILKATLDSIGRVLAEDPPGAVRVVPVEEALEPLTVVRLGEVIRIEAFRKSWLCAALETEISSGRWRSWSAAHRPDQRAVIVTAGLPCGCERQITIADADLARAASPRMALKAAETKALTTKWCARWIGEVGAFGYHVGESAGGENPLSASNESSMALPVFGEPWPSRWTCVPLPQKIAAEDEFAAQYQQQPMPVDELAEEFANFRSEPEDTPGWGLLDRATANRRECPLCHVTLTMWTARRHAIVFPAASEHVIVTCNGERCMAWAKRVQGDAEAMRARAMEVDTTGVPVGKAPPRAVSSEERALLKEIQQADGNAKLIKADRNSWEEAFAAKVPQARPDGFSQDKIDAIKIQMLATKAGKK